MRTPLPVDGTDGAVSISSATGPGIGAICVLRSDATVACGGQPYGGRLGRNAPPNRNGTFARTPVAIPGLRDITVVDVGRGNVCAVDRAGHVSCLGTYALDELGHPHFVLDPVRLQSFG